MFFLIFQRLIYRVNYSKLYEQYVLILKYKIYTIFIYQKEKSLLHDQPQKRRYLIYDVEMTGNMTIVIVFLTYRVSRIPWSEIIQVKRKPPIS